MQAPIPRDERARLAALDALDLVGSPEEPSFDDIVKLAQLICDMPIALVSLVTETTQWFKARVGLELRETPRDQAICAHALESSSPLVVSDLQADARFADNPLVTADPSLRFYAGIPIRVAGAESAMGTLCVLDRVPRTLNAKQLEALAALARRVEVEMTLRKDSVTTRRDGKARRPPGSSRTPGDADVQVGERIGDRYRIERLLGAGGMGRVYEATDTRTAQRVAVKVMGALLVSEEEAVERFAREARSLLRLESPHIARFVDAGNLEGGSPFLVIEYLEGHDLAHDAARRMTIPEVISLGIQACEGTATAHRAGIVHRDLKPANLFLAKNEAGGTTLKLLDFGIAKLVSTTSEHADASGSITDVTKMLGSPRYMSPEQLLSSRDVDGATDIWALGVVLYELLTGGHPFDGESVTILCANVFTKAPRSVRELAPDVSPELQAVVLRCLAREKKDRWPTVDALRDALLALGER